MTTGISPIQWLILMGIKKKSDAMQLQLPLIFHKNDPRIEQDKKWKEIPYWVKIKGKKGRIKLIQLSLI